MTTPPLLHVAQKGPFKIFKLDPLAIVPLKWNIQFEDRSAVGAPAVGASSVGGSVGASFVGASSSGVSAAADLDVAPATAVEEGGLQDPGSEDFEVDFDVDGGFSLDAGASLDTKVVDATWKALLDKLVLAYKISCASKMPEPAMDQAPSFGCGCDQPCATRSVTCYYVTGVITRDISFCRSCHDGDEQVITLLKQYHLFPASPTDSGTAFHMELLGLFGDARNVLLASIDGFSKILAHRFYGGKRSCGEALTMLRGECSGSLCDGEGEGLLTVTQVCIAGLQVQRNEDLPWTRWNGDGGAIEGSDGETDGNYQKAYQII
ncbi:hypothetical protein [Absidia glauca]|uniref:Uncharacterized protein n=1 Tax=Absidia glauca TaxID=4829 RepID=A0A168PF21_ABSGL|nr:hypothetical protein [Absidia glauca]